MQNKRGQGLSTNAIILIILGIIVLVVLAIGFIAGWDKILPWLKKNNVDTISNSCEIACSSNSKYDYCTSPKDLKADDKQLKKVTCNFLANEKKEYGIAECPSITCDQIFLANAGNDNNLTENDCTGDTQGRTIQTLVNNELQSFDCILS